MPEKHSRVVQGKRFVWFSERLWELARDLPVKDVAIEGLPEFDQNCWFGDANPPTCREVAHHAKRINDADLAYPIILSSEGYLMDGGHRIAKAWLLGMQEINAVQFSVDPEPDYVLEPDVSLQGLEPRLHSLQ
jgi:hypothetical protein